MLRYCYKAPQSSGLSHNAITVPARSLTRFIPLSITATILATSPLSAGAVDTATNNTPSTSLADLSVEQLMNVSVTSVTKHESKLSDSAAAISVITQDDIRRLNITSIPGALRLVPGLDVAEINSHEWAVSARGFDNEYADKLLVLVDGRSIYGTGFGGVIWSAQNLPMEDIDRIEVIRGPGASLWGANAVNGVINIITKSAKDTQGALVVVEGGTFDQPATTVRYGGTLATNLFYRTYVKVLNSGGLETSTGQDAPDKTFNVQGGMRLDWEPSDDNKFTLQGDIYRNRLVENNDIVSDQIIDNNGPYLQTYNEVNYNSGGNVLGRWTHNFSDTQSVTLQAYYDRFKEEEASAAETQNAFDLDAQHRFNLGNRNEITWGLGYRDAIQDFRSSPMVEFPMSSTDDQLFSSFVQDEMTLIPDRLKLTLGSKLEHNSYTGWEVEPSARLLWTPTEHQSAWAAVSRGVRTPDWLDTHANVTLLVLPPSAIAPVPQTLMAQGNPNLTSENVTAYELGYRIQPTRHLSFDVAGFYNAYRDIIATSADPTYTLQTTPSGTPYEQIAVLQDNSRTGHSFGAEVSARWDVTDSWHLTANYSWLGVHLGMNSNFLQANDAHQAQLISTLDLPWHLELNGDVGFVDKVDAPYMFGQMTIPSYVRLDVGLIWHATKDLEFGVWGQNLAQDRHAEFTSYKTVLVTEIPRGVSAKVTWRF